MSSETDIVQKWIDEFGIHAVLDAERVDSPSPMTENWDLKKVWTCWDSYDQMGSFVSPGFVEKEDVEGELYVSAWFLGTQNFKKSSENIQIMDRDTCDECDTEGCEFCDDLGWIETEYLLGTSFYPQDGKPESDSKSVNIILCTNCGETLTGKFCSNCGLPSQSES